jgi:hypothetical protein
VNEYWNNLRPLEKRLVVAVGSVLFIMLNFWFVVPHFSDLSKVERRMNTARQKHRVFQAEIDQASKWEIGIKEFEGGALSVPQEDQANHFSTAIQSEAARTIGIPSSTGRIRNETNQFFLELSQNITVVSKEQPLVEFLYNLGSSNSLIRVRDLGLHPDPQRHQLMASIKLVASYQRKLPAKKTTGSAPAVTPATKPAASPPPKKASEPVKTPVKAPEPVKSVTNAPAKPATNTISPRKILIPNKKQP